MPPPDLSAVPAFYHDYIRLVGSASLDDAIHTHFESLTGLLGNLTEEAWNHAYAPGKWTIKEVVQHIIDAERIFTYRALCIARGEQTPLPGFDENRYAEASMAGSRTGADLLMELFAVGSATICLFRSFSERALAATGLANGAPISVQAIGYILCGHALHHTRIIEQRYITEAGKG